MATDVQTYKGLPLYRTRAAPEHLLTRSQLHAAGLTLRRFRPAAWLYLAPVPRQGAGIYPLYDRRQAHPRRPLTPRQAEVLAAGRAARSNRLYGCPGCEGGGGPRCLDCQFYDWLVLADRYHDQAVHTVRALLADPAARIVDTETTTLGGYIVQVAVTDTRGHVLFESMVNPQAPIDPDATAVHGFTDTDVADAPMFADIVRPLTDAIGWAATGGGSIVAYNAAFDRRVLRQEFERLEQQTGKHLRIGRDRWVCVMELRSMWQRAIDEDGELIWSALGGGHDAVSDCQAVARLLAEIASEQAAPEPEQRR